MSNETTPVNNLPRDYGMGPLCDVLQDAFGIEFEFWDTGGGCTALVGEFESGIAVYVTDCPSSPNGHEATITDQLTRVARGETTVGFAIGVYRDEHQEQIAYGEYPTATMQELPAIVRMQLATAR